MIQAAERVYTAEEYLELELNSSERHEFVDGAIRLMTGGTPEHNLIAGNLLVVLKLALRGQPFSPFVTDQRLWIPARNLYTYPDVEYSSPDITLTLNSVDCQFRIADLYEDINLQTSDL